MRALRSRFGFGLYLPSMVSMHRGPWFVLALALGMGMSDARAESEGGGGVRVIAGGSSALVRRNRLMPWHKLGSGAVPEAMELSCEETCRVKVDAENVLTLSPDAIVVVGATFFVPLFSRDSLVPAHQVELRAGKIEALSPSARAMPLVVSSLGTTHVALRAAEVQVSFHDDHMAAQVTSGTARVGANRHWISLEQGQRSTLPAQGAPKEATSGLAAPEWMGGPACSPGLAISRGEGPSVLGGCWKPVDGAASYVVELSRAAEFSTIETTEKVAASSWSKSLGEGAYFVRVRGIDENGLVGATSAHRRLGTAVVKVPPGSTVDASSRTFTVPQGRSLEFPDPSGLEIALDDQGFLPARRFMIMDGVPSHVMRVRFKDAPSSQGSVVLQRRALSADVSFSPKLARWPQDPIDITVTLADASGAFDPSQVSPKIHVLVGLTEIAVEWSHTGSVWAARLAPRNVAPTVVRVIAEDEFGTPLGRNFVEVDQGRTGPGYVAHK